MVAAERTLIDDYLEAQQRLQTPVARFSHHATTLAENPPALEPVYRDLIPLSQPGPGEQLAFEVELDACTGCKACVSACHSLNGLDDTEVWRDVGAILGGSATNPFLQTITTACHHCADPGCLKGCPVLAYDKDPLTGIVRHLDDQCIGCQYCVLMCPYDVPKYNERLGIVRKCDMCHQRLAVGEAPACVQACPTHAIRIVTVSVHHSDGVTSCDTSTFLAAAPDPAHTQPTTRYVSRRPLPTDARATDADTLRPQPGHTPLVVMLTLLPAAIGLQTCDLVMATSETSALVRILPLALGAVGLAAATLHLGQPLRAWRIFLGLRTSWFSREAVLFGQWFGLTALAEAAVWWTPLAAFRQSLVGGAALSGFLGLGCSAMIYAATGRKFWRFRPTLARLLGSGAVLALAAVAPMLAVAVLAMKLAAEWNAVRGNSISARLLRGPLRRAWQGRWWLAIVGGVLLLAPIESVFVQVVGGGLVFAGELLERRQFFRAVDAPKMPGVAATSDTRRRQAA